MSQIRFYKPTTLRVAEIPTEEEYEANDDLRYVNVLMPREDVAGKKIAWLPHSCDEWVIGGSENVKALIADLRSALAFMKSDQPKGDAR